MMLLMLTSFLLLSSSFLFTRLKHPLAMGLALISQTVLVCINSNFLSKFTWFSYILFLIFLGATLVLFIYVASLASNEMFSLSYHMMLIAILPLITIIPLMIKDYLILPIKPSSELSSMTSSEILSNPIFNLSMIYNPSISPITSFIILYLLLTLVVIVKLSSSFTGPLRLS